MMRRLLLLVVSTLAFSQSVGGSPVGVFYTDCNSGAPAGFTGAMEAESGQGCDGIGTGTSVLSDNFLGHAISLISISPADHTLASLASHSNTEANFLVPVIPTWDRNTFEGGNRPKDFYGMVLRTFYHFDIGYQSFLRPLGVQRVRGASLDSDCAEAYYNMGNAFRDQGKLSEAISCYEKALEYDSANWGMAPAYDVSLDPVIKDIPRALNTLAIEWYKTWRKSHGQVDESWAIDSAGVISKDSIAYGPVRIPEAEAVISAAKVTTVPAPEKPVHVVEVEKSTACAKHFPEQEYEKAYAVYLEHHYDKALSLFQDFLQRYPRHHLADNAQYWVGEIYYDLEDYAKAILAFREVVIRYAEENKTPDALLKIGYTYIALDDPTNARVFIERVIKHYPVSEAASKARAKLKELEKVLLEKKGRANFDPALVFQS